MRINGSPGPKYKSGEQRKLVNHVFIVAGICPDIKMLKRIIVLFLLITPAVFASNENINSVLGDLGRTR